MAFSSKFGIQSAEYTSRYNKEFTKKYQEYITILGEDVIKNVEKKSLLKSFEEKYGNGQFARNVAKESSHILRS